MLVIKRPGHRMKAVGTALVLTIPATRIHISESKLMPTLRHGTVKKDTSNLVVYPSSWRCEIDAIEEQGWILDTCEEAAMDEQEFYVFHGRTCNVFSQGSVAKQHSPQRISCQRGRWTTVSDTALDQPHSRQKRWFWFRPIFICRGSGWWWWWRGCRNPYPRVKKAPTYPTNCTPSALKSVYYTPAGQEAITITWVDPQASDSDGSITSNQQVSGTRKGELFAGSTRPAGLPHTIIYKARDNDGLTATCSFSFNVKVRTCDALLWPPNGHRDCDKDSILGSTCNVSCNDGYRPVNDIAETTCTGEDNPQWSAEPSCERISCSTSPDVSDGNWTCDRGYKYGDYCVISCRDGYTLQGQVYTHCMANGSWFWLNPTTCTDGIAPELKCSSPQIFYTDRASTSASVVWELPVVTDNSGDTLIAIQTSGPDPGASIEAGSIESVTYVATDAADNHAPSCTVEIRVEATSCSHPLDTLEDARLRFSCTTDPKYIYGDACNLTCAQSLPLEGTELITCERNDTVVRTPVGYWDWGNGSMPYCSDIRCPAMQAPRNGALVSGVTNNIPTSTMLCNNEHSLAVPKFPNFNGIFICQDDGRWNPYYESLKAPDCSEQYSSRGYKLPSDFFYYEGVCSANDTALANYDGIVANLNTIYAALCPDGTVCETRNTQVTCGAYRKKRSTVSVRRPSTSKTFSKRGKRENTWDRPHVLKKRQTTTVLSFSFDIVVVFDTSQMTDNEQWAHADYVQLDLLKPGIQAAVDNGTFNRPRWAPLDSFQTAEHGDPFCDPGLVLVPLTSCSKCPSGHFASDTGCMKCPIGEYCETGGCPSCAPCLDGYSTRNDACESADNCTQLCTPGTYSPDTFVPCAKCKAGTYQPHTGQILCLPCPMGTSTKSAGSTAEEDCQAFDAIVTDTGGDTLTVDIPSLNNLALEFFIKVVSGAPDIVISVNGELDVAIAETITVSTASTADDIGFPSDDAWIQVSIYWDATTGEFRAFYRGYQVVSHSSIFPTTTPLVQEGELYISASGGAVAISGLRLQDTLLQSDNITATTCHNIDTTDVVNMADLKYLEGITLLVPSVCDVVDECLTSPCGEHSSKCTNNVDGFTCTCKGGWTGVTCDSPPDYCLGNDCQNGATCFSGLTNYTCQCYPGYSGVDCNEPPVNGGWSVWNTWSDCSATCNTGSRERIRSCDSPTPDPYGQDCVGVDIETEDCNTETCPVCPDIERGVGVLPDCEVDPVTGTQVCTAICITDGYVQPLGLGNDTYTCGMETDYKWQPKKKIPGCVKPDSPTSFNVSSSASIDPAVPAEAEASVTSGIASNMASTACGTSDSCNVEVRLGDTESTRRRRNTGTTVTITYSIAIDDMSDLQLDQYIQNGTISPGLQEIIDAVENLEATAVAINDSASTYFDVTADGVTYSVDTDTVTFEGGAICSEGQVVTDGICAECPAGSYQDGDYCSLCGKGSYQDQTGQSSCVQCPTGLTTETVGSDFSTDCSVVETISSSSTSPSSQSTNTTTDRQYGDNDSDDGVHIIIIVVVSILAVLILGAITVFVCIKKHKTGRAKIADSTPNLRDSTPDLHGMNKPVHNVPPMSVFIGRPEPLPPRPGTAVTVRDLVLDVDTFEDVTE